MNNIEEARNRCEYASKLLKENGIPHAIKNADIGHINLFYNNKVVMSFWARTGKFIFTINPKNVELNEDLDRGINNCIKVYKKEMNS